MTAIDICNIALGYLSHPALTSMQDARPEAELCRRIYPVVLSRCLGVHGWSFATRTTRLHRLAEKSPHEELPSVYALPPGCIRVMEHGSVPFVKEGGKIYSRGGDVEMMTYVTYADNPDDWPARFMAAVCYLLASELSMPLSGNAQLCQLLQARYADEINSAISEDCMENCSANQPSRPFSRFMHSHRGV